MNQQIETDRLDERRPKPARLRSLVRWAVAVIVVVHGLIHLLGASKGLGWSHVSQLQDPISAGAGVGWLTATVGTGGTGVMLAASIRWWWIVGNFAVVVSQAVIATSWNNAKAGTIVNVVLLAAVVYGAAANGPTSFRAEYRRRVATALTPTVDTATVTEQDLHALPVPVAAYVRQSGAIGQPRITNFRADISGRIRGGPTKDTHHRLPHSSQPPRRKLRRRTLACTCARRRVHLPRVQTRRYPLQRHAALTPPHGLARQRTDHDSGHLNRPCRRDWR